MSNRNGNPLQHAPRRRWDGPTPEEIRSACLAIQREWSHEERAERWLGAKGFAQLRRRLEAPDAASVRARLSPFEGSSKRVAVAGQHSRS
jgi:hypothetical protein